MRLEPVGDIINAIVLLHQNPSPIISPDAAKGTTRCFLIESVGPGAKKAGYKEGDIVVAKTINDLLFYGGAYHRAIFEHDQVVERVLEVTLDEFVLLDGKTPATQLQPEAAE